MPVVPRVRVGLRGPAGVSLTTIATRSTNPVVLRFSFSDSTFQDVTIPLTTSTAGQVVSGDITDATVIGRTILTAVNAAAVKTALGIVIADLTDATTIGKSILAAADGPAVRTLIGALALPAGGTDGQALVKSGTAVAWASVVTGEKAVPAGGASGQVLAKTAGTDYALGWVTPTVKVTAADVPTAAGLTVQAELDDMKDQLAQINSRFANRTFD